LRPPLEEWPILVLCGAISLDADQDEMVAKGYCKRLLLFAESGASAAGLPSVARKTFEISDRRRG